MLKIVIIAMMTLMKILKSISLVTNAMPKTNKIESRPKTSGFALDGGLSKFEKFTKSKKDHHISPVVVVVAIITSVMVLTGGRKCRRCNVK